MKHLLLVISIIALLIISNSFSESPSVPSEELVSCFRLGGFKGLARNELILRSDYYPKEGYVNIKLRCYGRGKEMHSWTLHISPSTGKVLTIVLRPMNPSSMQNLKYEIFVWNRNFENSIRTSDIEKWLHRVRMATPGDKDWYKEKIDISDYPDINQVRIRLSTREGGTTGSDEIGLDIKEIRIDDRTLTLAKRRKEIQRNFVDGIYEPEKWLLAMKYLHLFYRPEYHGWVESPGWDDMWCHQPIKAHLKYVRYTGDKIWLERVKDAADNFILHKMQRPDGSVHCTYRAETGEFEGSRVERNTEPYDLGRAHARFIDEMCALYDYTQEKKYLKAAIRCGEYVLENWKKIKISESIWAFKRYNKKPTDLSAGAGHLGLIIEAFIKLYLETGQQKWLTNAREQGEALLYAQCKDPNSPGYGLFSYLIKEGGALSSGWESRALSGGMRGISALYGVTKEQKYYEALKRAIEGIRRTWSPKYGYVGVDKNGPLWKKDFCPPLLANMRYAEETLRAAYVTGNKEWRALGENILYFFMGENPFGYDLQDPVLGCWSASFCHYDFPTSEITHLVIEAQTQYFEQMFRKNIEGKTPLKSRLSKKENSLNFFLDFLFVNE